MFRPDRRKTVIGGDAGIEGVLGIGKDILPEASFAGKGTGFGVFSGAGGLPQNEITDRPAAADRPQLIDIRSVKPADAQTEQQSAQGDFCPVRNLTIPAGEKGSGGETQQCCGCHHPADPHRDHTRRHIIQS